MKPLLWTPASLYEAAVAFRLRRVLLIAEGLGLVAVPATGSTCPAIRRRGLGESPGRRAGSR